MIRRVTEYVIICDAERILGKECVEIGGTAFGSPTMADCAASAAEYRWKQISKRLWLCPSCAQTYEKANAASGTAEGLSA